MSTAPDTIRCINNFGEDVDIPTSKFYFRPSAYGFIVRDGEILVMSNKSNDKLWFPGGGVEIHEKLEEGLKREVKEETGLEIEVGELVLTKESFFYYQPLDQAFHSFLFFYKCSPLTDNFLADEDVDDLESEKPRWKSIKEIQKEDFQRDLAEDFYVAMRKL
jgi:8-oxo-dGTP pyrophosphatase MutT (NUDIX family)